MVTSVPSDHSPRLFTIASGTPFLATLADAFLSGELIAGLHPLADPLAMSSATCFLPTRRAVQSFSTLLAERSGHQTVLLPRIIALGDSSETEDNLLLHFPAGEDGASLGAEADPLFRTMTLAQLIMKWKEAIQNQILAMTPDGHLLSSHSLDALQKDDRPFMPATTPHDALALADALGRLDLRSRRTLGCLFGRNSLSPLDGLDFRLRGAQRIPGLFRAALEVDSHRWGTCVIGCKV